MGRWRGPRPAKVDTREHVEMVKGEPHVSKAWIIERWVDGLCKLAPPRMHVHVVHAHVHMDVPPSEGCDSVTEGCDSINGRLR